MLGIVERIITSAESALGPTNVAYDSAAMAQMVNQLSHTSIINHAIIGSAIIVGMTILCNTIMKCVERIYPEPACKGQPARREAPEDYRN